jgi:hypothetical protein
MLRPWTVAVEHFSGDGVLALAVAPVLSGLRAEFDYMRENNMVSTLVMDDKNWAIVEKILGIRIDGGAAYNEKRKVGLLQPHHRVAAILNPFSKPCPNLPNGAKNPNFKLPNDAHAP